MVGSLDPVGRNNGSFAEAVCSFKFWDASGILGVEISCTGDKFNNQWVSFGFDGCCGAKVSCKEEDMISGIRKETLS